MNTCEDFVSEETEKPINPKAQELILNLKKELYTQFGIGFDDVPGLRYPAKDPKLKVYDLNCSGGDVRRAIEELEKAILRTHPADRSKLDWEFPGVTDPETLADLKQPSRNPAMQRRREARKLRWDQGSEPA